MRWLILFALVLGGPAAAASRATYASNDQTIVVEVADNGDARIARQGAEEYGLMVAGAFYLVSKRAEAVQVARATDVATALDRVAPAIFKALFSAGGQGKPSRIVTTRTGTKQVLGFTADVYRLTGVDPGDPKAAVNVVVTRDPRLGPVGKAVTGFMEASMLMVAPLLGDALADEIAGGRVIAALGAPIETPRFRLTAFEQAKVPPERVTLPAAPLTVDQIVKSIKLSPAP